MRRRRTDRGSVVVEVALVIPLLVLLVIGTAEAGFAFRSSLKVGSAARSGARAGALSSATVMADDDVLVAVGTVLAADAALTPDVVVLFRAPSSVSRVPDACLTPTAISQGGNAAARCTVYRAADVTTAMARSEAGTATSPIRPCGNAQQFWCPTTRNVLQTANTDLDRVGVYVRAAYGGGSRLIIRTLSLSDTAIMSVEPSAVAS